MALSYCEWGVFKCKHLLAIVCVDEELTAELTDTEMITLFASAQIVIP